MRSHGRILVSIWRDKDFIARTVPAQRAYMMLLAQKDINNAGVQPLMIRKWAKACDHTTEADVIASLDELQAHRFICYDTDTEELLIRSFIRNDGIIKQPNILKNALRVAEQTESPRLRKALADELGSLKRSDASEVASRIVPDDVPNPYGTLPEPLNPSERVSKGRGDGVGEGVTKRSELTSTSSSLSSESNEKPTNYRMITLPDDWAPNDLHRAKFPTLDIDAEADAFRDRQLATGRLCNGRGGWDAAFNSWLRESQKRATDAGRPKHKLRALADMTRAAEANENPNTLPDTDQRAITG